MGNQFGLLSTDMQKATTQLTSARGFSEYLDGVSSDSFSSVVDECETATSEFVKSIRSQQISILGYAGDENAIKQFLASLSRKEFDTLDFGPLEDYITVDVKAGKVLDSAGATLLTLGAGVVEGVLDFVETGADLIVMVGTGAASIFSGLYDLFTGSHVTEDMWEGTKAFVSDKKVESIFDSFYADTTVGRFMKDNAYGFDTVRGIGKGVGYTVGVVAVTALTFGTGGAAISAGQLATTAGVMGFSNGTEEAWADGASTLGGLAYGAASGAWEAAQWYAGGKINQLGGNALGDVAKRIALDTVDSGIEGFVQPGLTMIYKDYGGSNFGENYAKAFESMGGWGNVATQAAIGSIASTGGEVFGLRKAWKEKQMAGADVGQAATVAGGSGAALLGAGGAEKILKSSDVPVSALDGTVAKALPEHIDDSASSIAKNIDTSASSIAKNADVSASSIAKNTDVSVSSVAKNADTSVSSIAKNADTSAKKVVTGSSDVSARRVTSSVSKNADYSPSRTMTSSVGSSDVSTGRVTSSVSKTADYSPSRTMTSSVGSSDVSARRVTSSASKTADYSARSLTNNSSAVQQCVSVASSGGALDSMGVYKNTDTSGRASASVFKSADPSSSSAASSTAKNVAGAATGDASAAGVFKSTSSQGGAPDSSFKKATSSGGSTGKSTGPEVKSASHVVSLLNQPDGKIHGTNVTEAVPFKEQINSQYPSGYEKYKGSYLPKDSVIDDISVIRSAGGGDVMAGLEKIEKVYGRDSIEATTARGAVVQDFIRNNGINNPATTGKKSPFKFLFSKIKGSSGYVNVAESRLKIAQRCKEVFSSAGIEGRDLSFDAIDIHKPYDATKVCKKFFADDVARWKSLKGTDAYDAMKSYTGSGYHYMNGKMRDPSIKYSADPTRKISNLSNAFENDFSGLQERVIIYRGPGSMNHFADGVFAGKTGQELVDSVNSLGGGIFSMTDNGFGSATPVIGEGFSHDNIIVATSAPKGTKGAFIGDLSSCPHECEYLFQAGYGNKQMILGAEMVEGKVIIYTEMI